MQKFTAYFEAESPTALHKKMVEALGASISDKIMGKSPSLNLVNSSPKEAPLSGAPTNSDSSVSAAGANVAGGADTAGKGKRGRKAGVKVGPYNKGKKEGEEGETEHSDDIGEETEGDQEEGSGCPSPSNPNDGGKPAAPTKPATADDAINALKLVNSKKNTDTARACLAEFGVKRCGELTDENRGAFVAHCEKVAAS